jgi:hypothetical protein
MRMIWAGRVACMGDEERMQHSGWKRREETTGKT